MVIQLFVQYYHDVIMSRKSKALVWQTSPVMGWSLQVVACVGWRGFPGDPTSLARSIHRSLLFDTHTNCSGLNSEQNQPIFYISKLSCHSHKYPPISRNISLKRAHLHFPKPLNTKTHMSKTYPVTVCVQTEAHVYHRFLINLGLNANV